MLLHQTLCFFVKTFGTSAKFYLLYSYPYSVVERSQLNQKRVIQQFSLPKTDRKVSYSSFSLLAFSYCKARYSRPCRSFGSICKLYSAKLLLLATIISLSTAKFLTCNQHKLNKYAHKFPQSSQTRTSRKLESLSQHNKS